MNTYIKKKPKLHIAIVNSDGTINEQQSAVPNVHINTDIAPICFLYGVKSIAVPTNGQIIAVNIPATDAMRVKREPGLINPHN